MIFLVLQSSYEHQQWLRRYETGTKSNQAQKPTHFRLGLWLRSLDYSPDLFLRWTDPMSGQEALRAAF